jgi:putative transcriptional regulator
LGKRLKPVAMTEKYQTETLAQRVDSVANQSKIDVRALRKTGFSVSGVSVFTGADVRSLRDTYGISQAVLALYLGTSTAAVSQWELNLRRPTGATAKLLELVQRKGLAVLL